MSSHDMRTAAQRVGVQVGGLPLEAEEQGAAAIARDPRHAGAVQHPQEHVQNRFDLETGSASRFDLENGSDRLKRAFRRWLAELDNDLGGAPWAARPAVTDRGPGRGIPPGGGTRPGPSLTLIRGGAA